MIFFADDLFVSFFRSSGANATLQEKLGEVNTALHVKGEECSKLTTEHDLLATQLAEQRELLAKT